MQAVNRGTTLGSTVLAAIGLRQEIMAMVRCMQIAMPVLYI